MNYDYPKNTFSFLNKIHKLFLVFCLMLVGASFGQISEISPGTYPFTIPAGVTSITVECWGAGGGGANGGGGGADGGGGGGYARSTFTVTPGDSYDYVVGTGGASQNDGSYSSFGKPLTSPLLVANGGKTNGTGGSGNTGTTTYNGGSGGKNTGNGNSGKGGAGGGSAAGSTSNGIIGSDASNNNGASGGAATTGGGKGGDGGSDGVVGSVGSVPGGGGGGGGKNKNGGQGGNGQVKITYCPIYSLTSTTWDSACVNSGTANIRLNGLPDGTFAVTYNVSLPSQTGLTATMTSSGGTGVFIATGLYTAGSSTVKITNITSGSCSSIISSNNTVAVLVGNPSNPSFFSFPSTFCKSAISTFSINAVANASSYTWTTTESGWTITPASDGLSASIYFSPYATAGNLVVYANNACGLNSVTKNISFSTSSTVGAASSSPNICLSSAITNITHTTSGATGIGTAAGLPSGVSANWASNKITISGTPTATGIYNYSIPLTGTGGCPLNATGTITVNALPTTPTLGPKTDQVCSALGTVELQGLPTTGTINQTGTVIANYPYSGTVTTKTISNLAPGTYAFTVSNGSCTSSETASVVINPIETKTWNGSAWSGSYTGSAAPNLDQNIIFNGLYNSTTENVNGCSCEVKPGVTVNINSGLTLNLVNKLTVALTATMTFFDTASLVQKNDVKNSGEIDYQRKTSTFRSTDYVYWSSPVSNQDISNLSAETINGIYYSYNSSVQDWNREYAGDMAAGVGYIVRSPDFISGLPVAPGPYTASFVGEPNNGTKTLAVSYTNNLGMLPSDPDFGASYLLGNPYPSALDAEKFLDYNAGVLGGTIYFWMHNTALDLAANIANPGPGWAYTYSLNDYAAYNAVGGVAVGSGDSALSGGNAPSGKIAAGQGFFATAIASGPVVFNNDMRVIGDNTQFFKTRKDKTDKVVEKNRIWLNLTNTQGVFKQTLIGYVANATNQYDIRYDGESYNGNAYVDFYSVNQDKNLTIQGRALPFSENDEVALGFTTTIDGPFTINIDHLDGALTDQNVYIEDKLTNTTFDLKSGNYTFNTEAGTFNDRFVLRYTAKTLSTNDFNSAENKVLVSVKSKQITVNAFAETIKKVTVYDLLGRQIYVKDNVDSSSLLLSALNISHQTLVVKTTLENGKTLTDKIIY